MWWEYAIIIAGLAAAVAYVLWMFSRAFTGKGACKSGGCGCTQSKAANAPRLKVTPLIQVDSQKKVSG